MSNHLKCLNCSALMEPTLTKKGVLIDMCSTCRGVWLDQGEINFFIQDQNIFKKYQRQGLQKIHRTTHQCPKCHSTMRQGQIPGFSYEVEECMSCKGLYFSTHEFEKFQNNKVFKSVQKDSFTPLKQPSISPFHVPLPSLALTTWAVGLSLYGMLFGVLVFLMEIAKLPAMAGYIFFIVLIFIQFYFAPIFLDWQLKWCGSLDWVPLEKLPTHFKNSLTQLCSNHRIPIPRMGIIRDGSPQAYTYGRTPYSARVVFSEGMFQLLDSDEIETVLAHELGHIKHWDFVVMTVIKLVPIILYNIYCKIKKVVHNSSKRRNKKDDKGNQAIIAALVVSYVSYLISEYLVLFVSRVREYYADRFSCFATKKPNSLLKALVKISYGLLNSSSKEKDSSYEDKRRSVEALNIMNVSQSKQLALVKTSDSGFHPESIKDIMRWDLWNPWAFLYELHSTHPLTAKRINAISSYAVALKQQPYLLFKREKPESYWDDFFGDLFILFLPYIAGIASALAYVSFRGISWNQIIINDIFLIQLFGVFVLGLSLGSLIKILKSYPGGGKFFSCAVSTLLKVVKVSPVRSYPIILKGYIIGRGDAGQIFSEDFFLKDKTGMIFLDHEPFGLNFLFAVRHFKRFQGKEVTVRGWYRRSPSPYLEVKDIHSPDYKSKAYTYNYKIALGCLGVIIALFCIFHLHFVQTDLISEFLNKIINRK